VTTRERMYRILNHKEADRVPIVDQPWAGTIRRWIREGMPDNADYRDYFNIDKVERIGVDISPRYPVKLVEETDRYVIYTTGWGVTLKQFKEEDSTPDFIDFKVNSSAAWQDAKKRMLDINEGKVDFAYLEANYPRWVENGSFIQADFWFGFDVAHSWMSGTETILVAMLEEPEWVMDIFDTYLTCCIKYFDMVWDRGFKFDSIYWPDDMGYKNTTFFSKDLYEKLLKPFHKRAVYYAHEKGVFAHLHSCGNVMNFLPDIVEIGVDILNPLEVKAGMDPLRIKKAYGEKLSLHGGVNAVLWSDSEKIIEEIKRVVPKLKENGGYIFASDHSIPNSVSFENFSRIISTVKEVGSYN
jgi:uroporphyrinogen decarboxylase